MAKEDKKTAAKKDTAKKGGNTSNLPKRAPREGEVGVDYIAKKLGIEPASARVRLRNANIEKADTGAYSWTKEKADKIVAKLEAEKGGSEKSAKESKKKAA